MRMAWAEVINSEQDCALYKLKLPSGQSSRVLGGGV
jgi:hypothetical protein